MFYLSYFVISLIPLSSQTTVKWIPDTKFNLPINFKNGKIPCSKQTVIFPERLSGSVRIDRDTNVNSFILPVDGEIVLDGTITLGEDKLEANCTEDNVYYMEKSKSSWTQPDVWSSSRFNKATPDSVRVPCFDDVVEFPANIQSTVVLPDSTQYVRYIQIGNQSFTNSKDFYDYVASGSDDGIHFILNNFYSTGIVEEDKQCGARSGCPCQKNVLKIDCSSKDCSVPSCVHPVKPIGHCCKICGGYVLFDITEHFDMMEFKELVDEAVDSYGRESLEYHIGRFPDNKVQLVIVDKDEYRGTSAEVLNVIDNSIRGHWVQGPKYAQISGSPLSKSGMGGKIFVSMFFAVVFVLGTIYVYYYKIPDVRFPVMGRGFPEIFSRIQRRSDSVVSLTRRDSTITTTGVRTAFRNPLYDSRRGRVQVEESVTSQ